MNGKASKFENRTTIIVGKVVKIDENGTANVEDFTLEVPYVRSTNKAIEVANGNLNPENNPMILVTVTEVKNEAPKKVEYSAGKLKEYARVSAVTEEEAHQVAQDGEIAIMGVWYEYNGQIWMLDKYQDDQYKTMNYSAISPAKYTKAEARQFVIMYAEEETGYEIIGVHGVTRREQPLWFIINENDREKCIKH